MAEQQKKPQTQQDLNQLLKVRREKLAALQEAGKDPFEITKYDQTHHSDEVKELYTAHEEKLLAGRVKPDTEGMDEAEARKVINDDYNERRAIMDASPIQVSVAGRMMFKRVMGKASFCNIQDLKGKIQIYVSRDSIGEEPYAVFKKSDIGDIYGIKGYAFRTKTGEISIHASHVTLLSKSLQILPEKFHGLTNTDIRYRQRYVDLIMNADVKETFIKRSRIISAVRQYLNGQGFLEVETPMLVSNTGGAAAAAKASSSAVGVKIVAGLLVAAMAAGGAVAVPKAAHQVQEKQVEQQTQSAEELAAVQADYDQNTAYLNVISELQEQFGERTDISRNAYSGLLTAKLVDFDGDGEDELFCIYNDGSIRNSVGNTDGVNIGSWFSVYSWDGERANRVPESGQPACRHRC